MAVGLGGRALMAGRLWDVGDPRDAENAGTRWKRRQTVIKAGRDVWDRTTPRWNLRGVLPTSTFLMKGKGVDIHRVLERPAIAVGTDLVARPERQAP